MECEQDISFKDESRSNVSFLGIQQRCHWDRKMWDAREIGDTTEVERKDNWWLCKVFDW
jgi:hypothetical protein